MTSTQKIRSTNRGSVVEVLTLIVVVIQAIALIILYVMYEGEHFKASAELSSVQKTLVQLEQKLKDVELVFANQQKILEVYKTTAENAEKSLQIIERIRPHADIDIDPKVRINGKAYEIHFTITNSGHHLIYANPKGFYVLKNPVDNVSQIQDDNLLPHTITKAPTITNINPAEAITHRYFFEMETKPKSTIYFLVEYDIVTDPVVTRLLESYAKELNLSSISEITKVKETFEGSIEQSSSNK